jgi:hypothetical protein
VVAGGTSAQGVVVVADGECGVTDLADGVVEVAEGFCDALPDQLRGQVDGCLQAEPDMEEAGNSGIVKDLQYGHGRHRTPPMVWPRYPG